MSHTEPTYVAHSEPAYVAHVEPGSYDRAVLSLTPVMYLAMSTPTSGTEADLSGNGHNGTYYSGVLRDSPTPASPASTTLPNGNTATAFDGLTEYLEIPDHDSLSCPTTGELTVTGWMRPDTLEFPVAEGSGTAYANWFGKSNFSPNQEEWEMRMNCYTSSQGRPNRTAVYHQSLSGGLGSGTSVQETVTVGEWMFFAGVVNMNDLSKYDTGIIKIYKNGAFRNDVALNQFNVIPTNGTAPVRVGCSDLDSRFFGGVGKVAVFDYELSGTDVTSLYNAMVG